MWQRRILVPATLCGVVLSLAPAPASAATAERVPASARAQVSCSAAVENPHFSRGANSVIFKARITCEGDAPPVQVRLRGTLGSIAGGAPGSPAQGPSVTRATSDQTQTIRMGGTATFYTPATDGAKVRGSQTYVGNIFGEIIGPPGVITSGPNRAASRYVYVTDPG